MSSLMDELEICDKIPEELKNDIKYYHVFNDHIYKCALFVTNDDRVYGLGDSSHGMLGVGHFNRVEQPEEIIQLRYEGVKQFYIGNNFVLALTSDNRIYSWGNNVYGQLAREEDFDCYGYLIPKQIECFRNNKVKIKQISCGDNNVMVLMENSKVFVWGWNNGRYLGREYEITEPEELKSLHRLSLKSVHCYTNYYFGLTTDNKVYSWGWNSCLGHDTEEDEVKLPRKIQTLKNIIVIDIRSLMERTYFLTRDGKLYFCGKFYENLRRNIQKVPILIECEEKLTQLECINKTIVVLSDRQILYEMIGNNMIETEFKSIEEYSVIKWRITHKTITV